MHETSIAQSLISLAESHLRENDWTAPSSVTVKVGKLSGVMPDALAFAFDAMKAGTLLEGARLFIEEVKAGGTCGACGGEFTYDGPYILSCPLCGGADFRVTRGRELELHEMEVAGTEAGG